MTNPTGTPGDNRPRPAAATPGLPPATLSTRLATAIATGLGAGFSPVAPGTAGTIVAVPLGWAMLEATAASPSLQLPFLAAVTAVAVWSAGVAATRLGLKDPGQVVVDEVAGYLVTVAFLPASWTTLLAGFVLFRLFDITKPPPCRRAEALPGGVGIVADDVMAGIYANLALQTVTWAGFFSP